MFGAYLDDFEHGYHGDELGEDFPVSDELMEEIHRDPISEEVCGRFVNIVKNMRAAAAEAPVQTADSGVPFVADRDSGPTGQYPMDDEPEYHTDDVPNYEDIPAPEEVSAPPPYDEGPDNPFVETPAASRRDNRAQGASAAFDAATAQMMGAPTLWGKDEESDFSWLRDPDKLHYYALRPDGEGLQEVRHDAVADGTWLLLPGDEMPLDTAVRHLDNEIENDYNTIADTVASALSRFGAFSSEVARAGGGKGAVSAVNFAGQIAPMVTGGICSKDMRRILIEECERGVPPVKGHLLDKKERERLEGLRREEVRQRYSDAMRLMMRSADMIYYGGDDSNMRDAGDVIYQDIMRRSAKKTLERTLRGRDPEAMKQAAKTMAELSKRSGGEMHGNLMRLTSPDNMLGCCMIFNTMNPVMLALYLGPILLPGLLSALFWMRERNRLGAANATISDYRRLAVDVTMAELSGSMGQVLVGLVKNGCDPREALTKLLANVPKMEASFSELCKLREEMLTRYPAGKTLSEEDKSRWNELLTRYGQVKRQFYQQLGNEVNRSRNMAVIEGALEVKTDGTRVFLNPGENKATDALKKAHAAAVAVGATEAELSQQYVQGQSRFSSNEAETYVRMKTRYDMLTAELEGTCDALSRYSGIYSKGELPAMHVPEPPTDAFRHAVSDLAHASIQGGMEGERARTAFKNILPLALPMFLSKERGDDFRTMLASKGKTRDLIDIEMLRQMKNELAELDKKEKSSPNGRLGRDDAFRKALLDTQVCAMLTDKTVLHELSDAISYGEKDLGKWSVETLNQRIVVVRGFIKNEDGRIVSTDLKVPIPVSNYTDKDRIDGLAELAKTMERWEAEHPKKEGLAGQTEEALGETMLELDKENQEYKNTLASVNGLNRHDVFAGLSRIEATHIFGDLERDAQAMPDEDVPYYEDLRTWREEQELAVLEGDTPQRAASILPLGMGRYDKDIGENRYDKREAAENEGIEMDTREMDDDDEYIGR